jgi:hypothetical protein
MYACLGLFLGGDGGLVRRVTRDDRGMIKRLTIYN